MPIGSWEAKVSFLYKPGICSWPGVQPMEKEQPQIEVSTQSPLAFKRQDLMDINREAVSKIPMEI